MTPIPPETLARLVYAAIGAAVDCGATTEQIVHAFRPEAIVKMVEFIREKKQ